MLREVAEKLDDWVAVRNREAQEEGLPRFPPTTIKVLGQTALLEAGVALSLAATNDVDAYADYPHAVEVEFRRLLAAEGRELDPLGHEVWMPPETQYEEFFKGRFVRVLLAEPEAILLSKALKAPAKNRPLIVEYLASGASERFLELAQAYQLDLEQFL
jgi:hypothetical protein